MSDISIDCVLNQAKNDNQENLIPIIELFFSEKNNSVSKIRSLLGKGVWKSLCSKSKGENKIFCLFLEKFTNTNDPDDFKTVFKLILNYDDFLINTFIENLSKEKYSIDLVNHALRFCSVKNSDDQIKIINNYYDTKLMFKNIGIKFNESWSAIRVKNEHDKALKLEEYYIYDIPDDVNFHSSDALEGEMLKTFGHAIDISDHLPEGTPHSQSIIRYKVLKDLNDYYQEYLDMKHCILSYCKNAYKNNYITISLFDLEGRNRSTVGYNLYKNNMNLPQYIHWNDFVQDYETDCDINKNIINVYNMTFDQHESFYGRKPPENLIIAQKVITEKIKYFYKKY